MLDVNRVNERLVSLSRGAQKAFHIYQREQSPRNKKRWNQAEKAYRAERNKSRGFV